LLIVVFAGSVGDVKAEPYGWSPQVDFSNQGPPKCTDSKPDKAPILLQPNHPVLPKKPKKGEVVLYWHRVPGATGYNVYYGLTPKNYIFSAPNVGDAIFYSRFPQNPSPSAGRAAGIISRMGGRRRYVSPVLGAPKLLPSEEPVPSVVPSVSQSATMQVKGAQTKKAQPTYQPRFINLSENCLYNSLQCL
jgi:hypothetical protein